MYGEPSLKPFVLNAGLCTLAVCYGMYDSGAAPAVLAGLSVMAAVFGFTAFWYWANWLIYQVNVRYREQREAATITVRLKELQAVSRLTDEQAKLVPTAEYAARIGTIATEEGPQYVLICPGGNVPLEWVRDFLADCGVWKLRSIRTYPDKTPSREYARIVTDWCIWRQLAVPAVGNEPAHWSSEHARSRAAEMCGLRLELNE